MFTICIHNLQFVAFHGCFEEEKILGNKFTVNLEAETNDHKVESINDTVNYVHLFQIIKKHMDIPTKLLENVMQNIVKDIFTQHQAINTIDMSITKNHPPIKELNGRVCVKLKMTRERFLSLNNWN